MAYMNQERKAAIAAALKAIIPKSWKYSLAVRHHSTIVLTIAAAPVDLISQMKQRSAAMAIERNDSREYQYDWTHADVNPYHWETHCAFDADTTEIFRKIFAALNAGNHDRSDSMTDYFDVGWYVDVNIGKWNKPFIYLEPAAPAKLAA